MTIVEFVEARLAEKQRAAEAARDIDHEPGAQGEWHVESRELGGAAVWSEHNVIAYNEGYPKEEQAEHIALNSPAQALRECAGLRQMIDAEIDNISNFDGEFGDGCDPVEIRAASCCRQLLKTDPLANSEP